MKILFLMVIVAMGIFSRGEDECVTTPIKAMDPSSPEDTSQQIVSKTEDGQKITYYISAGQIFRKNEATGSVEYLSRSDDVKSILSYKDQLVALRNNGDVYLWRTQEQDWIRLEISVRKLLVFEENTLVALTESGKILVFPVRPGDEIVTYTNAVGPDGVSTPMMIPSYGGREEAFLDTAISNVENIVARDGDIFIGNIHGHEKSYRSIRPSLNDLDSEFNEKVMGGKGLTCRFKGKKKDYPVEAIWFQKESGTLYATVSYKIQGAWLNNSPAYKMPLILAIYANRGLPSPHMLAFFQDFIRPSSSGSWALEMCFQKS